MDTSSALHPEHRLALVERMLTAHHHHVVEGFERQCHRFAPEAFANDELYDDLFAEAIAEYVRRLIGYPEFPADPAAWIHKYSDEALLRAKELVWSGADHDHEGDDYEPAIQRPDRLRHTRWIIDLYCDELDGHPQAFDRASQCVEIIVYLCYHAGASGQITADRFPYAALVHLFGTDHLPIDGGFVDWTVAVLAEHKPEWLERNILSPLDSRRDAHTFGDRASAIAETTSCPVSASVTDLVEDRWLQSNVVPDLTAAIAACRQGAPVEIVLHDLLDAEPWIRETGGTAVLKQITAVLIDFGAAAT